MKRPISLLRSLLADVKRLDPMVQGLDRDNQTIESRFEHEGIGFLTIALGLFAEKFDSFLALRQFGTIPGFACIPGMSLPKFLSGLTSNVFDLHTGALRKDYDIGCIKSIRQICRFLKKSLIDDDVEGLHQKALSSFERQESEMRPVDVGLVPVLVRASTYILRGLSSQTSSLYEKCKHGPGAVVEKAKGNQKWKLLVDQIEEFDPFPSSFDLNLVERDKGTFSTRAELPATSSRFVSVPKSANSRRGITVEPLLKQFYQQGLNTVLREAISRCPSMSQSLDLTDQSKNQHLALEGSRTGEYATIDLSSASDRLSLDLVKVVFGNTGEFLERIIDCRSRYLDRDMLKFAGMGNATTFPVQSVVFAVIAICAILSNRRKKVTYRNFVACSGLARVYGDDIIVPTCDAPTVITWLESCGLRVNTNKTFLEGNFRESCGVDAFEGVELTPIYYRVDPRLTSWTVSQIETLVSTSNQLWLEGYYSLSDTIRNLIDPRGKYPLVPRGSGVIGWTGRNRVILRTKVHRKYQSPIYRAPVSLPKKIKDPLDSYPALFKFFLTPLLQRDKDHLKRSVQRYSNQVRWRWVPVFPVTSTYIP